MKFSERIFKKPQKFHSLCDANGTNYIYNNNIATTSYEDFYFHFFFLFYVQTSSAVVEREKRGRNWSEIEY